MPKRTSDVTPLNDVFISYNRGDAWKAAMLAEWLERDGFTVWWDQRTRPATPWDSEIEARIEAAGAVLVVWSPRSVESAWVRAEADYAHGHQKLLPVMIEPCRLPLAYRLIQAIELPKFGMTSELGPIRNSEAYRQILQSVKELAERKHRTLAVDLRERQTRERRKARIGRWLQFLSPIVGVPIVLVLAIHGYNLYDEFVTSTVNARIAPLGAVLGVAQVKAERQIRMRSWAVGQGGFTSVRLSASGEGFVGNEGNIRKLHLWWSDKYATDNCRTTPTAEQGKCKLVWIGDAHTALIGRSVDGRAYLWPSGPESMAPLIWKGWNTACGSDRLSGQRRCGFSEIASNTTVDGFMVGSWDGQLHQVGYGHRVIDWTSGSRPPGPVTNVTVSDPFVAVTWNYAAVGVLGQGNTAYVKGPCAANQWALAAASSRDGLRLVVMCNGRAIVEFHRSSAADQFSKVRETELRSFMHSEVFERSQLKPRIESRFSVTANAVVFFVDNPGSVDHTGGRPERLRGEGRAVIYSFKTGAFSDYYATRYLDRGVIAADAGVLKGKDVAVVLYEDGRVAVTELFEQSIGENSGIGLIEHRSVFDVRLTTGTSFGDVRIVNVKIRAAILGPTWGSMELWEVTDGGGRMFD